MSIQEGRVEKGKQGQQRKPVEEREEELRRKELSSKMDSYFFLFLGSKFKTYQARASRSALAVTTPFHATMVGFFLEPLVMMTMD